MIPVSPSGGMLSRVPAIATTVVALAAAALAAVATSEVAVAQGAVSEPWLGWLIPLVIEGGAICAGLLAWERTGAGKSAVPERLALVALIALAVVVNAAHASGGPLGVVLAACPPLVLIGIVELRLRAIAPVKDAGASSAPVADAEGSVYVRGAGARVPMSGERTHRHDALTALHAVHSDEGGTLSERRGEREEVVDRMLAENSSVTGREVGEELDVSAATGRRLLAAARERAKRSA